MNPIQIERSFYTMATTDGNEAEITMYGEIVEQRPTDWWTGRPIEGNFIIGDEFLEDLKQIENCSAITIRMNSGGGDAAVSIMIHNRLRELAAKGKKLTCRRKGCKNNRNKKAHENSNQSLACKQQYIKH